MEIYLDKSLTGNRSVMVGIWKSYEDFQLAMPQKLSSEL
jgi:hypothetical protein